MVRVRAILPTIVKFPLLNGRASSLCSCHWTDWQYAIHTSKSLAWNHRFTWLLGHHSSYLSGCSFFIYFCCLPLDVNLLMLACEEAQSLVLFSCLTAHFLGDFIQSHDFKYHPHADDCQQLQLRSHLQTPVTMTSFQLSECLVEIWRLQVAPEGKRGKGELSFRHTLSSPLACSRGTCSCHPLNWWLFLPPVVDASQIFELFSMFSFQTLHAPH